MRRRKNCLFLVNSRGFQPNSCYFCGNFSNFFAKNMPSSVQEVYHVVSHRPIYFWSANDVDQWLRRKRPLLALKYALSFLRHNITGRVLVELTDEDLREIGIELSDDRQGLLLEIKKEKLYSDLDEFSKLRTQAALN
ncbi:CRE-AVE-1 protein [Caenorhabditis remanei]|uniref:CRE-AVE-1 protein n=1 Tax=Caenorhabditis remanei TaxID=31234 RepID=E3MNL5_CAERE|nr:CRE-AVE-1 protein [Caenorhabditis remanei]